MLGGIGAQARSEHSGTRTILHSIEQEVHGWEVLLKQELWNAFMVAMSRDRFVGKSLPHKRLCERALRKGQDTWFDHRNSNCLIAVKRIGGTITPIRSAACWAKMTADRTLFLRGFSQGYQMERY